MCQVLKWRLAPTTLFSWVNWYMIEWDNFAESPSVIVEVKRVDSTRELIQFKTANKECYAKYRELMQLIDCAILSADTLQYK